MEPYKVEWIPLTPAGEMAEREYDVLIVGSGAGGAAVLRRLAELWGGRGRKVGMLEAGGLLLPTHGQNLPTVTADRVVTELFARMSTPLGERLPDYPDAKLTFGLGGRTLFWTGGTPRMPACETADWPLSRQELERYYRLAEQAMDVTDGFAGGSALQDVLLSRLREHGYPHAAALPMAVRLDAARGGRLSSGSVFSSIDHLAYAQYRMPFDLAAGARVTEVLLDGGRAAGVKAVSGGCTHVIHARTVVVAAGGFITPQILLHSGVPGQAIGRYLTNHSTVRATGRLREGSPPEGPAVINVPQTEEAPYQIQLFGPAPHYAYPREHPAPVGDGPVDVQMNGFARVESRAENRVYLDPVQLDADGVPLLQVAFTRSSRDLEAIDRTAQAMRQAAGALGLSLEEADGASPPKALPPGDDNHEACTCRMGRHPDTSAADPYGQIHGVPGLYVADNSLLPSIGAANPTLTTVALAIRTADCIAERLGG
ncbi:GMC oxidoreductase [Paenibacillus mucilaginosus]|uniref:2-keto-gluconate dehydrogenase n=1 Tax=Paenibacillus mucilaginosus (strain KNP414) TaxID=1036673 RepID=F8FG73_PAEMK|nr:GMC family oxidoreductase [Paenibacillus mucilaginosus]AEI43893.1 2-keto-gluconate dehydrogenase [Paenibacillus mucilaginosus KNP414]MCG7212600.1 GMC family oxidoreductase [Paenibacillus mucilaginosus]WDM25373.1 GMC family oxidoreductase [Paenibacillus mucilaginosus]